MASKEHLKLWVLEAVQDAGGEASVLEVAKQIWKDHEVDLTNSGDLFFTWQYDMRWAAQRLRDEKKLKLAPKRKWGLVRKA